MKNPFVQMALMAAAITQAFQENAMRSYQAAGGRFKRGGHNGHAGSSKGYVHKKNPAGSKIAKLFAKKKATIRW